MREQKWWITALTLKREQNRATEELRENQLSEVDLCCCWCVFQLDVGRVQDLYAVCGQVSA